MEMKIAPKATTVTKKQLVGEILSELKDQNLHPNQVRIVIQTFLDKITDCLSDGGRLEFRDFGVFEIVVRKAKVGRNPKAPTTPVQIPARNAVKFTPGKKMKQLIEQRHDAIP